VDVRVGFGVPEDGDIIFHVHFTRPEGLCWVCSYSYGQLCSLDNFVNYNCDKIKHVFFPILTRHRVNTLMKILANEEFHSDDAKELVRIKTMIENWLHVILLRLHSMPLQLHNRVEKFLCLAQGPDSNDEENTAHIPGVIEPNPVHKKTKSVFGMKKKQSETDDGYEQLVLAETEAEARLPPLLKVNVRRGREGRYGKLEYEVNYNFARLIFAFI
jgi:hypothetical protein